jgi:ABC-type transporter Mla maintaining outer membrane lipid asymmetry ATPase subunit MlaF
MADSEVLVELNGVEKDYRALRPLRIQELQLRAGESVALVGLDSGMAEVLVNLVTAAQLPDKGEVRIFGRPTASIADVDAWVADLDRFGLISDRAVLVEQLTAEQNLALPLSLEIDDMPAALRDEVGVLASEVALTPEELRSPTGTLTPLARLRLRLGRALALRPRVILAEHPNAGISPAEAPRFAADFARVMATRSIASLTMTADVTFATAIANRVLTLQPATGVLRGTSGWRRWFS